MNYVQPIRDTELVNAISDYIKERFGFKYQVMYEIGINTGLRISDILSLQFWQVRGKEEIHIHETKTHKAKIVYINGRLAPILDKWCNQHTARGDNARPLIYQKRRPTKPVSRMYAYRVLSQAAREFGLDNIGTHTLRKTYGYHYYKRTKDICILQKLFNHSDPGITMRYIGIIQDDLRSAMMKILY